MLKLLRLKLLRMFLNRDQKTTLGLVLHVQEQLETKKEQQRAFDYLLAVLEDGRVSVPEWTQLGKKLGVFKNRK